MPEDLYRRWSHEIERNGFFHPGERAGVAVSGGPDSMLLFDFMKQLAGEMGLVLAVVHFNHRLRGSESDADEDFVRELAGKSEEWRVTSDQQEASGPSPGTRHSLLNLPSDSSLAPRHSSLTSEVEFIRADADVRSLARENHRNLEATARDLRYRFFFSLVDQGRLDKVATAHTANDQAETVLLRLLRGAGSRGLGGIRPVLEGKVVRPFLSLTRSEVEAEVARRRLPFRIDSTNRDTRLVRNKVRLELLPALAHDFNPAVVKLLRDFADLARDDEDYMEQQAAERAQAWRVREGALEKIPLQALLGFPAAIERRVLRQMIGAVRRDSGSINREHVEAVRRLARESQSGRRLSLPGGVTVLRDFDWLVVAPGSSVVSPALLSHEIRGETLVSRTGADSGLGVRGWQKRGSDPGGLSANLESRIPNPGPFSRSAVVCFAYEVTPPAIVEVRELGLTFHFKILGAKEVGSAYNNNGVAYLDGRKLAGELILRNWRAGDCFRPLGSLRVRKLKELFRERKIEAGARLRWPVLECDGKIVWVRGFPPGAETVPQPMGPVLAIEEEPFGT